MPEFTPNAEIAGNKKSCGTYSTAHFYRKGLVEAGRQFNSLIVKRQMKPSTVAKSATIGSTSVTESVNPI
jgi:hypothetical protein